MPTDERFFSWVLFILKEYWPMFLSGVGSTLLVALSGTVLGFLIGLLVAIVRTVPIAPNAPAWKKCVLRALHGLMSVYIEVFRGTPMIVQAMVIYYGAMQFLSLDLSVTSTAVFIVSINTGAYMAEIIRGGILSVDRGQREASVSIGLTHWQMMTGVVLPQAVRNIMPSIGNEFIVNIKDSSVLNVISLSELYFTSKSVAGTYYRYFEVFFITAMIYLFLTFTITRLLRLLERKMDGPQHYTIHGSQSYSKADIKVDESEVLPND